VHEIEIRRCDRSVEAVYHKHHLWVSEYLHFRSGPYLPTTVTIAGHTLGLIICWEGVYPFLTRDFSQVTDLVSHHKAQALLWSVGGVPSMMAKMAKSLAQRYNVPVVGSATEGAGVIIHADGSPSPYVTVVPLDEIEGYTAKASVAVADLELVERP